MTAGRGIRDAQRRFGEVRGYNGPRLAAPDVTALKLRV
jgi:hypothetical protein